MPEKQSSKIPFMKAYRFIVQDPELSPGEKLVMIVICSYWPNPSWQSNKTMAETCGFTERYVEMLIRRLKDKKYIKTGYAHTKKKGKSYTARVIVPIHFPKQSDYQIQRVETEQSFGQQTEQSFGCVPNNRSQNDRTIVRPNRIYNRKYNRKASPAPLPAEGQASAPLTAEEKQRAMDDMLNGVKPISAAAKNFLKSVKKPKDYAAQKSKFGTTVKV